MIKAKYKNAIYALLDQKYDYQKKKYKLNIKL